MTTHQPSPLFVPSLMRPLIIYKNLRPTRAKLALAVFVLSVVSLVLALHTLCTAKTQVFIYSSETSIYLNSDKSLIRTSLEQHEQQRLIQEVGNTDFESPRANQRPHRRLPHVLIIGVRKCGTRALLEMLNLHPRIQKASGEVHFFDRDENYLKGLEYYRSKMPESYEHQITIEKSPSYFVTSEASERIRAMNASIKLLLIVREPVVRAISDYTQLRSHSPTRSPSNASSPSRDMSFEELALRPDGTINESYRPIALSIYHSYMSIWLETFSRHQILIVSGDTLIARPATELAKIESFLNIEPRLGPRNFYFNKTKGFYCIKNASADKCLKDTKGRRHPDVDPDVISKLRRFFSLHNQKFYELGTKLNKVLSSWKRSYYR
ncbi:heparan sulfate glucosamine 3-O-sulfotransferase 5 [Neocloeon triangulifer]|uniref:heparan sulfate glucosamine 3-O-sulfotransferase 5 n=1 Tax=Neocloeon triangulifer TaxID=2078957 RepID=UPI00286F70AC|nr:heparan sulfate glucosamine 3-O-sulfotransferase 5 [Neocloeon triangulifer]XP_059475393.1 heparan sulfate glucosamine 3-O-sulfotransferase 5 [Neocloeon triangulifer]